MRLTGRFPARLACGLVVGTVAITAADAAVYRCEGEGGGSFSARVQGDSIWLKLPNHAPVLLRAVPAASGAKYGDGPIVFWSKGERASVHVGEAERYVDCLPGTEHPYRNRYTAREAGVRLQLPESWNESEYTVRVLGAEGTLYVTLSGTGELVAFDDIAEPLALYS